MFFLLVYLQRAEFRHILFRRVNGITAIGQHDDANNNKNDSKNSSRSHLLLERASTRDQINDQDDDRDQE